MKQLQNYLVDACREALGLELDQESVALQIPPKKGLGDLCLALFPMMKELKKSPDAIADALIAYHAQHPHHYIEAMRRDGPYLNFELTYAYSTELFCDLYQANNYYPCAQARKDKNICIDFIGVNIGKPLHIGHMCTPVQGQVFINMYKKYGYTVISDSHIGDWGIIFGKLIYAYSLWGDEEKLKKNAVDHLLELYVKITKESETHAELEQNFRDTFKKLSQGDEEFVAYWLQFRAYSIDALTKVLERLQVQVDYHIGESFYEGLNLPVSGNFPALEHNMDEIVQELLKKNIATQNDDRSVGVVFEDDSFPSCILQKRDGTHGYLASDLACIKYRCENWSPEKIIYFVDNRQELHLKQAFYIAKKAGWLQKGTELIHAKNGFIAGKNGTFSTRKGNIIKLDAFLDEAETRAKNIILEKHPDVLQDNLDEIARIVGTGAVKYGYLKKSREQDSIFDWDEYMNFDGNSGPYIQYAYVRAKKLLQEQRMQKGDYIFSESIEKEIIQKFNLFPDILSSTLENHAAHTLCLYIYELTKIFSSFYASMPILKEEDVNKRFSRLALVDHYKYIIEESFSLLAIELPEYM